VPSRLLLLITDLELGGTPTVVRELAIRLRKAGDDVEVACLSKWGPVAAQLAQAGVPVTALNARGPRDLKILPRLIRLIRVRDYSTVFSFLMHANTVAAAASLAVKDVRWIQSIQTTQPTPAWHWGVQKIAQRFAEKVVVPSPSVAAVAHQWAGVPAERIFIIPNAIDLAEWTDAQSPVPAADPRPYPVTFLGRLDPVKDVPSLIQAVAKLSPLVQLHIHGEGADRARIQAEIDRLHAPVTMNGPVASPQKALADSGLLVLPSLAEGFGLVLIEAMAAGVPVIATNVPGIRDVVRHNQTGLLVPASDPAGIAYAIMMLVEDCVLRQRLIANAAEDVRKRFSWETVIQQYRLLLHA
jgi:glycosyltransferase involved in cell wall biosynthesis